MGSSPTPHHIELIYTALLASFWRKAALRKFLRACHVSENFLAGWPEDESKREFLDRLFAELAKSEKGDRFLERMSAALCEQTSFPDLVGWEDSEQKVRVAQVALEALRRFEQRKNEERVSEEERKAARLRHQERQERVQRSKADLEKLSMRLKGLSKRIGAQQTGYDFQDWFYDFIEFFEMTARRPYVSGGRQIDGSITHEGTTYLVELKFTESQASVTDIDSFLKKVNDKADNTMGVFVSISGYSSVAINGASGPRTPLLLLDSQHLYAALTGMMTLPSILARVRRHASQTSEAYLEVQRFGQ